MMQRNNRLVPLKLAAIALVAAFAVFVHLYGVVGAQEQPGRLFEMVGMSVPFEQRIGVDDGAEFVVHFGGDTRGTLDACG